MTIPPPTPETIPSATPAPPSPSAAAEPALSLADIFPLRIQATLVVLLLAFLGLVGWKVWQPAATLEAKPAAAGKIDLNRADRAELLLLDRIGPELADRIVAYREKNGPFEGLGDLRKVTGIGPATLELMRPRVVLSWTDRAEPKPAPLPSVVSYSAAKMSTKSAETGAMIDPNRASLAELQTLPGIGPKMAQRIVDQRTLKPFVEVTDLRKVPGIGPKTLDKIKPRLTISGGATASLQ